MSKQPLNPTSSKTTPSSTALSSHQTEDDKESLIRSIKSQEEFDELLKTIKDKYIIVEFYAVWCGPCKKLTMKFQEMAKKYQDKVIVLKVDIEQFEELAFGYDVTQMPSFMIMKDGKKLEQYFGSKLEQLDGMANKYLETTS